LRVSLADPETRMIGGEMTRRTNASCSGRCFTASIAVAVLAAFPESGVGQGNVDPIAAAVAQPFTMIERSFVALAEVMPPGKYTFKPTDGEFKDVRTFGEHVKHVACANFAFFNEIENKQPPDGCDAGGPSPAKTKPELLMYLRESFAYAGRVLGTLTAENALKPAGGFYGGMSTRLGLATLAVWHASDHYGQLVVYLRMNGIVPPASRPAEAQSTPASAPAELKDGGAYGSVTRVELPFGNLDTSFIESDFRSIGIASGDRFQVRCLDKTFDVLLGKDFRSVPRGEWIALFSPQGALKIARSFASAAEASGCKAGDNLFISKRALAK